MHHAWCAASFPSSDICYRKGWYVKDSGQNARSNVSKYYELSYPPFCHSVYCKFASISSHALAE